MTSFILSGDRELLDKERTEQLVRPLADHSGDTLSHVKLSGKSFGQDAALVMASSLRRFKTLKIVDISDIISGRPEDEALQVLQILADSFQGNMLTELHVSDNALGRKGVEALRALLSGQTELERLFMNNNGLAPEAVNLVTQIILGQEKKPTKLRVVHMFNNLLKAEGAKSLSTLLANSPLLTDVRFSATRFGSSGGVSIMKGLFQTTSLCHIDVSDNNFGNEEAVEALATVIKNQPHLKTLNVRYAELGDEGTENVMKALSKATQLEFLDLSGNEISTSTAGVIAKALKNKKKLKKFLIEENELKSKGVKLLAENLAECEELVEVDFATNEIGNTGAIALVQGLAHSNRRLVSLQLNGNQLGANCINAIKMMMHVIKTSHALGSFEDNDEEEAKETDNFCLQWLPIDTLKRIFLMLSIADLKTFASAGRVCKLFKTIVNIPEIWKKLSLEKWEEIRKERHIHFQQLPSPPPDRSWKWLTHCLMVDLEKHKVTKGVGFKVTSDGSVWIGEWADNEKNGACVLLDSKTGSTVFGNYKDDELVGSKVVVTPSGERVEGVFDADGKGRGSITYPNGDKYDGEVEGGKPAGRGKLMLINPAGVDVYEGEFKEGKLTGPGKLVKENGDRYDGEFKRTRPDGRGVYVFSNGDIYEGDFKDGVRDGHGVFVSHVTGEKFDGNWSNDKPHQ